MYVCPNCFTNETAQKYIGKNGERGNCETCMRKRTKVIEASELADLFAPLFRLYAPAQPGQHYIYDPEDGKAIGGDEGDLLQYALQDWDIFSDDIIDNVPDLLTELWPEYESSTLYASDDIWSLPADDAFRILAHKLMHERRFFQEVTHSNEDVDIERLLGGHLEYFELALPRKSWFRARKHPRWIDSPLPKAFSKSEIGCPPKHLVTRGMRANPAGISYLYLASDEHTTVAEVRAVQGDYLTIGTFRLSTGLRIIDLAQDLELLDPLKYTDLEGEIERRQLLREFGRWLSKPVRDEDHEIDYLATQYLAEFILHKGYDGILFKSSLASGKNLVLFDPSNAKCVRTKLIKVKSSRVSYETEGVERNSE